MNIKTSTKISIKLESFNSELLVSSCKKIFNILQNTKLNSFRVVSLPKKKKIYCVLRSPHVDKDSREHFEIRVHRKVIEISYDPESAILDILSEVDFPIGVFSTIFIKSNNNK